MGERHACAVTHGGGLVCWGDNQFGQIGDGTVGGSQRTAAQDTKRNPTQVFASGVTAVSAGYAHTCAVVNGGLHCWGANILGVVNGKPSEKSIAQPVQVLDSGVTAVAAGGMHTCAVVRGAALCWGADERAIGKNVTFNDTPFKLKQIIAGGVTAIVARAQSTCAIVGGALQCWGDNRYGQISSARSEGYSGPVELIASGVTAVAIGGNDGSLCAVVAGALQCWGKKFDATATPAGTAVVAKPTQVIAQGVTAVASISMSICAVVHGGLQCWGYDSMGNIGAVGKWPVIVPNPAVVIAAGVSDVAMGAESTCALVNGALRCRGDNRYGAISGTVAMERHADSRPFSQSDGDVRTLSLAAAEMIAVKEKIPAKVAGFLQGKLVAHNDAVFYVRSARAGYLGRGEGNEIAFSLDVTPLYVIARATGGDASRDMVIAAGAECGASDLPGEVNDAQLRAQQDNGFVDLGAVFKSAFPASPGMVTYGDSTPLRFSAGDMRRIEACAKAINESWEGDAIKTLRIGAKEIPPSLQRSWSVPGDGRHGPELAVSLEMRPGQKADYFVEAHSVSAMQCKEVVLHRWKRSLSPPWRLRGQLHEEISLGYFYADEDSVQAVDSPTFPAYTQDELRRAINAELEREGMAPEADAKACAPAIIGYQYTVRNPSEIVKTIYNPGFNAVENRGCEQALPTLALRVADRLGHLRGKQIHTAVCKAWPGDSTKTIVALVREKDGATDGMADYDLDVAVLRTDSGEILQHVLQKGAITSDAMRFDGIAIDTANYALARNVRAFGLRTHHSHSGGTSSSDETLRLYVPQGTVLKPVLAELTMNTSGYDRGDGCNGSWETARTVALGSASNQGYAQLVISEASTRQEVKTRKGRCTEVVSRSSRRYVLPFDGTQYVLPAGLR